jgi:hypothetical protein
MLWLLVRFHDCDGTAPDVRLRLARDWPPRVGIMFSARWLMSRPKAEEREQPFQRSKHIESAATKASPANLPTADRKTNAANRRDVGTVSRAR